MFHVLSLRKPLVVLDCETTGTDPARDRVVELAMLKFAPGRPPETSAVRVNPGVPIPPAASAVHGIGDEHVAACPPFKAAAAGVAAFLGTADLAGFNVARFDLPLLVAEFARAGRPLPLRGRAVVDVMALFHRLNPRDLAAAVALYCRRPHEKAHRADADAAAAAAVLDAMLARHKDLPRTPAGLHRLLVDVDLGGWFRREGEGVVFARGKHAGRPPAEVAARDPGYLAWMAGLPLLPDARRVVEDALGRG